MLQSIWQISTVKLNQQQDAVNSCGENDWPSQFGDEKKNNLKELYAAQWLPRLQLTPLLQIDLHK